MKPDNQMDMQTLELLPESLRGQLPVNYYLLRRPEVFKGSTFSVVSDFHNSGYYSVGRPGKPIATIV